MKKTMWRWNKLSHISRYIYIYIYMYQWEFQSSMLWRRAGCYTGIDLRGILYHMTVMFFHISKRTYDLSHYESLQ